MDDITELIEHYSKLSDDPSDIMKNVYNDLFDKADYGGSKHIYHIIDAPYEIITEYEIIERCNEYKTVKFTCPICKGIFAEDINNDKVEKQANCPSCRTYIRLMTKEDIDKREQYSFERQLERRPELFKNNNK